MNGAHCSVNCNFRSADKSHPMNDHLRLLQPQLPTPVKVHNLKILVHGYMPNIVDTLISGFSFGFHIHFHGAEQLFEAYKLWLALENPEAVEVGQIAGPVGGPPLNRIYDLENAIETNMKEDITVRCTKCDKDTTLYSFQKCWCCTLPDLKLNIPYIWNFIPRRSFIFLYVHSWKTI